MKFEWDDNKSDKCFNERGFDFAYASRVFSDPDRLVKEDIRCDYGEKREITFGHIENRLFCVVSTQRGEYTRIISARKANTREVKAYADNLL